MTWHFFSADELACPACLTKFVPYKDPQPCPKCGELSRAETDFVAELVSGLSIHKAEHGAYTSGAYFVGSLPESVFHWCCRILDEATESKADHLSMERVREVLDEIDWGDQAHMRAYFSDLLEVVLARLSTHPDAGDT